ncbi:MAG: hypothetical protein MUC50_21505 [Myxococcota bacterium]|jgi:hypothetical protein|nr:hypothetical protein [Myxococcota bacterium]
MADVHDNRAFSHPRDRLLEQLAALRHRAELLVLLRGLTWTTAAAVACLVVLALALGWWGPENIRIAGWIVVSGVLVVVAGLSILWPLLALSRPFAVERHAGKRLPTLASDILSAAQLALLPASNPFSQELLTAHFERVSSALLPVPPRRIYPATSLIVPFLALLSTGGTAVFLGSLAPALMRSGTMALWGKGTPPNAAVAPLAASRPVVSDLRLSLRYPEYLHRKPRQLEGLSGGLVAPLGTNVVVEGAPLLRSATGGFILLPDGSRTPLTRGKDSLMRGQFVVSTPGSFRIALVDEQSAIEGPPYALSVEPDGAPTIRLLRPTGTVELNETDELTLELEAQDDHGLGRIDIVLRVGPGLEVRRTLIELGEGNRELRTEARFSPESVRLGEASLVELTVEAFDNDTISGPKYGRSEPLSVKILTPQGRHFNALNGQAQLLDALVDLLALRLENPPLPSKQKSEELGRFNQVGRLSEDVLTRAGSLIATLSADALTSKRVVEVYLQIRTDLSNQLVFENRLYDNTLAEQKKRRSVDRVQTRLLESAVSRVDDIIIDQQLHRVSSAGDDVAHNRGDVAGLLERYAKTHTEEARRSLLDAIARMELGIDALEKELETVRGRVDDTFVNPASELRFDLRSNLAKLRELIAAGDTQSALELVQSMESDIARLLTGIESGLRTFRSERFGEQERVTGELLDRIMAIESDQLQLRRETIALQRRYQEALAEQMRGRIDPLVKAGRVKVDAMARITEDWGDPEEELARAELTRLRVAVRELRLALSQGDLEEARQISSEIGETSAELMGNSSKDRANCEKLGRLAQKLDGEIAEAYPKPAQLFSSAEGRRLRVMEEEQRLLMFRTRKTYTWLDLQQDEVRFLAHRGLAALRIVDGRMKEAVSDLEARQVRQALSAQSSALDELARLREDLRRGDRLTAVETRPVVLRSEVELPKPNTFEVPREHREDILEAMRDESPTQYREAIRRYYETLVH